MRLIWRRPMLTGRLSSGARCENEPHPAGVRQFLAVESTLSETRADRRRQAMPKPRSALGSTARVKGRVRDLLEFLFREEGAFAGLGDG